MYAQTYTWVKRCTLSSIKGGLSCALFHLCKLRFPFVSMSFFYTCQYLYNMKQSESEKGIGNELGGEQRGSVVIVASVHWCFHCLPLKAPICFTHQPSATTQVYIVGTLSSLHFHGESCQSFAERSADMLVLRSSFCLYVTGSKVYVLYTQLNQTFRSL